jgi:hypothetical protein
MGKDRDVGAAGNAEHRLLVVVDYGPGIPGPAARDGLQVLYTA